MISQFQGGHLQLLLYSMEATIFKREIFYYISFEHVVKSGMVTPGKIPSLEGGIELCGEKGIFAVLWEISIFFRLFSLSYFFSLK